MKYSGNCGAAWRAGDLLQVAELTARDGATLYDQNYAVCHNLYGYDDAGNHELASMGTTLFSKLAIADGGPVSREEQQNVATRPDSACNCYEMNRAGPVWTGPIFGLVLGLMGIWLGPGSDDRLYLARCCSDQREIDPAAPGFHLGHLDLDAQADLELLAPPFAV